MGPSGAGKSTLLQAIAGQLYEPFSVSGIIKINNNVINRKPAHLRKVGMMFQDALLFEHMTVAENIAFGMPKNSHSNPHARMEAINTMLSAVELESMGQRWCKYAFRRAAVKSVVIKNASFGAGCGFARRAL